MHAALYARCLAEEYFDVKQVQQGGRCVVEPDIRERKRERKCVRLRVRERGKREREHVERERERERERGPRTHYFLTRRAFVAEIVAERCRVYSNLCCCRAL
jgi:hypothetical protein